MTAPKAAPRDAAGPATDTGLDVVTGAFSYSGAAIAGMLAERGRRVRTLTGHPERAAGTQGVEIRPLDFDDRLELVESLRGATTLYNTYWVRFPLRGVDHELAVANSRSLFHAARRAGVERVVHVSITHPSLASPYGYFRGKALVEQALFESGLSFAVVRPAILFGGEGILVNNIAWLLRRLPLFAVGGRGDYRIRPVHVDDLARLCLAKGAEREDSVTDAVGPERPAFAELVQMIGEAVGSRARIVRVPGALVPVAARVLGAVLRDVLLTADEYRAMADGLADTTGPATGTVRLSEWLCDHAETLGVRYANEIDRHFRR